jgi:hypothetical protein
VGTGISVGSAVSVGVRGVVGVGVGAGRGVSLGGPVEVGGKRVGTMVSDGAGPTALQPAAVAKRMITSVNLLNLVIEPTPTREKIGETPFRVLVAMV